MSVVHDVSVTKDVAAFVTEVQLKDFPPEAVERAKLCLLDALGVGVAGLETKAGQCAVDYALATYQTGKASIIGTRSRCNIEGAAWANSVLMNALDMDDGHREQVGPPRSEKFTGHNAGHPASVIIPAALATAQTVGANGGAFLLAILCAYEVTIRLAASRNPSSVLNNATGNWGAYGAAISSAKLLSLSLEQVVEALGIVCAFGPNPPRNLNVSYMGMVKESIGWASLTGASAAALAARGFTGKESVLDHRFYFEPSFFSDLRERSLILSGYLKPHASCRFTHAPIDGVLELCRRHDIRKEKILRIAVKTSLKATFLDDPRPRNLESAQFSIPFCVGVALSRGAVNALTMQEGMLDDQSVLEVAEKVHLEVHEGQSQDDGQEIKFPLRTSAHVEIVTEEETYNIFVEHPRGHQQNPLSKDELREKFMANAVKGLGHTKAEKLMAFIMKVDDELSLESIGPMLGP